MAKEIAIEAVRSMWRYAIPSSFYEVEYDKEDKCWKVEANYFEGRLSLKIGAMTGTCPPSSWRRFLRKDKHRV